MVLWPLLTIGFWVALGHLPRHMLVELAGTEEFVLSTRVQLFGALAALVPAALQALFLREWYRLFALYRQGRVFEAENVAHFRRAGQWLLALTALDLLLSRPIHSLILTLDNPPGRHMLSLGLSSGHLESLVAALVLVAVARAMDEGRHLRDEAELVV